MNRRFSFPNPFGPVDSGSTAAAMARLSAMAFWLWAAAGLMQAGLVWYASDAAYAEFRGATTGFAIFFALIAAGVPAWGGMIAATAMLVCAVLHVGGLRGSAALARPATAPVANRK